MKKNLHLSPSTRNFVALLNESYKTMVRTFFVFVFLVFAAVINFKQCNKTIFSFAVAVVEKIAPKSEPVTLEEKFAAIQKFAVHLEKENKISIPANKFAKIAFIVLYSESGLNTDTEQGLFQITRGMKASLGIPHKIWEYSFTKQLEFFEIYLDASKHLNKVKTTPDLHVILACPMKFGKDVYCKAHNKGLKALDFNDNGLIDREDFVLFDAHRAKENKFVHNIYKTLA